MERWTMGQRKWTPSRVAEVTATSGTSTDAVPDASAARGGLVRMGRGTGDPIPGGYIGQPEVALREERARLPVESARAANLRRDADLDLVVSRLQDSDSYPMPHRYLGKLPDAEDPGGPAHEVVVDGSRGGAKVATHRLAVRNDAGVAEGLGNRCGETSSGGRIAYNRPFFGVIDG